MRRHVLAFQLAACVLIPGCEEQQEDLQDHSNGASDSSSLSSNTSSSTSSLDTTEEVTPILPAMAMFPAGKFRQGVLADDPDAQVNGQMALSTPAFEVQLGAFALDLTEVTVEAYARCVAAGACIAPRGSSDESCNFVESNRARHPVNCVMILDAIDYCEWVGKRLPTESEWERAAAGLTSRPWPWGSTVATCDHAAWSMSGCAVAHTAEVGTYPAGMTAEGVMDLAGNVAEWTDHRIDLYPDGANYPEGENGYVIRGGSFASTDPVTLRSAHRAWDAPTWSSPQIGFRCAVSSE